MNEEILALIEQVIRDVKDVPAAAKLAFRLSENHIRQRGGRPTGPAQATYSPAATLSSPVSPRPDQTPLTPNSNPEINPPKPVETPLETPNSLVCLNSGSEFSLSLSGVSKPSSLGDRGSDGALPPGFSEWYAHYPRHDAKRDAIHAWRKLGVTLEQALPALRRSIAKWGREARPKERLPYPATWLNRQPWKFDTDDEEPDLPAPRVDKKTERVMGTMQRFADRHNGGAK